MAPSSNGQDTRFSSLQYGFDPRWCFQLSGCRLSLVEGSAWNGEVVGSNPATPTNGSFVQRLVYLTVYQRIGVRFPYGPPYEV